MEISAPQNNKIVSLSCKNIKISREKVINNTLIIKSPLKWAGGKRKLVSDIHKLIPKIHTKRLIEPFVGGGSVFLNSDFDEYLLVDSNPDLIDLFNNIKRVPHEFIDASSSLFTSRYNNSEAYYQLREEFNQSKPSLRRSALFLYLNRHG